MSSHQDSTSAKTYENYADSQYYSDDEMDAAKDNSNSTKQPKKGLLSKAKDKLKSSSSSSSSKLPRNPRDKTGTLAGNAHMWEALSYYK